MFGRNSTCRRHQRNVSREERHQFLPRGEHRHRFGAATVLRVEDQADLSGLQNSECGSEEDNSNVHRTIHDRKRGPLTP